MLFEGRGSKIMVAEHDRTILEMLQVRLDVAGYHPIAVRTGASVLEMLNNIRPAALVLDLNLPDIDGFRILAVLQAQAERIATPTLVVGRQLAVDDIRRAVSLGARDCLAMPFSGAEILDRLTRMLKRPSPPQERQKVAYVSH